MMRLVIFPTDSEILSEPTGLAFYFFANFNQKRRPVGASVICVSVAKKKWDK
jgi:hypothetical protein